MKKRNTSTNHIHTYCFRYIKIFMRPEEKVRHLLKSYRRSWLTAKPKKRGKKKEKQKLRIKFFSLHQISRFPLRSFFMKDEVVALLQSYISKYHAKPRTLSHNGNGVQTFILQTSVIFWIRRMKGSIEI